jgi:hypothetical protein
MSMSSITTIDANNWDRGWLDQFHKASNSIAHLDANVVSVTNTVGSLKRRGTARLH